MARQKQDNLIEDKSKTLSFNKERFDLTYAEVDHLIQGIETIKRRKIIDKAVINYVDPFGHVSNLEKPVNHLIIGRRGSGKTSLLIKVREELSKKNHTLIFIDFQRIRNLDASKILIKVLLELLDKIILDIEQKEGWLPLSKRINNSLKRRVLRLIKKNFNEEIQGYLNFLKFDEIYYTADYLKNQLKKIEKIDEGAKITRKIKTETQNQHTSKNKFKSTLLSELDILPFLKTKIDYSFELEAEQSTGHAYSEIVESTRLYSCYEATKLYQEEVIALITKYYSANNKTVYLFLDDFYQVKNNQQPYLFNFLHEISKETPTNSFSFNTCLVPNRFKLNFEGERILSHKDDFSSLNLDRDFDDLEENKKILLKILCGVDQELNLNSDLINKLFNDTNVLNNMVLASGALPRVFLDVFVLMVRLSKAEGERKIHNKVFHEAISHLRKGKEELIEEEAELKPEIIKELVKEIEEEIIKNKKTNIILYPRSMFDKHERVLVTLFNLGYLHRIKEEEKNEKGIFIPIMLDMTFTHGGKSFPPGFKAIKFWDKRKFKSSECAIWNFEDAKIDSIINK
jgi:hypothetical protein